MQATLNADGTIRLSHEERLELIRLRVEKHQQARAAKREANRPVPKPRPPAKPKVKKPPRPDGAGKVMLLIAKGFREADATEEPIWTLEDLAVACWQAEPDKFGLKGWSDKYPNNAIAGCLLWGRKGLIAAGLVERRGKNVRGQPVYRVTAKGREA